MSKFLFKSATDLAQLIRNGEATSTEIVEEHIAQIKLHNPTINALVILLMDEALQTAADCDQEAKEGKFRGPLHGVPMTVKEQYWVKGTKTTLNFKMFKDWTATEDAVAVNRLRKAGAVILGKSNVCKNLLDYQINGDIYPEGKNPYNLEYSPGGSSGGSSAALASGMVPIELGSDFGGSIRVPSSFCGLYGLKPTESTIPGHGLGPKPKGARGFIFHMAIGGPMARTPEDLEMVWKVIRGPHHTDRTTPRIEWGNADHKQLTEYRITWVDGWPGYQPGTQTSELIEDFVGQLNSNGCVTENTGPEADLHNRSLDVHKRLSLPLIMQELPWFIKPLMIMELKRNFLRGMKKIQWKFKDSLIDYSEIMGKRAKVVSEWEQFFEKHDFLICPIAFGPAFKRCKIGTPFHIDGQELIYLDYVWPYNACFNASGHPVITIPLGLNNEGLPVGVQVVGPYWSEPDLIRFAKLVSKFTPGFVKPGGY